MIREMLTLPRRAGVWATRLGAHLTARAAGAALGIAARVIEESVPTEPHAVQAGPPPSSSTFELDVVIASSPPPAEAAPAVAPASFRLPPEREVRAAPEIPPAHVSEGLRFVEAFAEPGAEEGAGASVHVREPWRGYAQMTANEVIVRMADSSAEELGAVALYEGVHRGRKTVMAQARRQLRLATAGT